MEHNVLNRELRQMAVNHRLCKQWQKDWEVEWSLDRMAEQFFRGIDFYLSERFVSREFIMENFDKQFLREKCILVDDVYSLSNPGRSILIGNSSSTIRFSGSKIGTVYLTDSSSCKILAQGNCHIIIHLLDDSKVYIEQSGNARVVALRHSESCTVDSHGNIKVKYELGYLK